MAALDGDVPQSRLVLVVAAGLLAASSASILIRYCQAPSLSIALYRIVIASAILVCWQGRSVLRAGLTRSHWRIGLASGFFLAVHFASWIASLKLTSIASSVVLVSTAPFFVTLGAWLFLGARVRPLLVPGLVIAFLGLIAITYADFDSARPSTLQGNALALLGAIGAGAYLLVGRVARRELDNLQYITLAYASSALFLLIFALLSATPFSGFATKDWLLILAIALVPQLIGHSAFNWCLRYLSAPMVSTLLLGEPVIAGLLAWILFAEAVSALQAAGSLAIILGVAIVIWAETGEDAAS